MRLLGLLIAAGVAVWVYTDAQRRGYKPLAAVGWMLGVFLLMIVFLPLYLVLRTRQVKKVDILIPCKYCGKYYEDAPLYCPNCGHRVGGHSFKKKDEP